MNSEPKQTRWHTSARLWRKLKSLARQKRHEPTPAEDRLWQRLRNHQLAGMKFRRQYTIERFIVDFFAIKEQIAIEVDGPIHDYTVEEDAIRQEFIESMGIRMLRFTNDEVEQNLDWVVEQIEGAV